MINKYYLEHEYIRLRSHVCNAINCAFLYENFRLVQLLDIKFDTREGFCEYFFSYIIYRNKLVFLILTIYSIV